MKRWLAVGFLIGFAAVLSGCSASTHQSSPDPDSGNIVDGTQAAIIQMPQQYRNVSFSCFKTNGVYVTSAAIDGSLPSGIAVVPNDPICN